MSASLVTASAVVKSHIWGAASTIALAGLLLPFGRRKQLKSLLGMVAILVLALYALGCGGGSTTPTTTKTPQTATYVVNVTASAGAGTTAKTSPLIVTVNN